MLRTHVAVLVVDPAVVSVDDADVFVARRVRLSPFPQHIAALFVSCCSSLSSIFARALNALVFIPLSQASDFMESTTKFMHSKKDNEGTDFGEVLEEAVNVGHAEGKLRFHAGFGVHTRHERTQQG